MICLTFSFSKQDGSRQNYGDPSSTVKFSFLQIMKQKKDLITQYPNSIIAGHIYLGTRQQALDLEMMKSMGITHIIRYYSRIMYIHYSLSDWFCLYQVGFVFIRLVLSLSSRFCLLNQAVTSIFIIYLRLFISDRQIITYLHFSL